MSARRALRPAHAIWRTAAAFVFVTAGLGAAQAAQVLLDGRPFHIETYGRGPSVIFEAGQGTDARTWDTVTRRVSKFARVFVYDRDGIGRSAPLAQKDRPITAKDVTTRLRALLTGADVASPFILVGHSLGGLYAQYFARRYPNCIAGVVLLDAASADAPDELGAGAAMTPGTAAYLEDKGVTESNRQVRDAGPFPDVPLVVVAATDHGPSFRRWESTLMRLQRQLATLSPHGRLIIARGSGHDVHRERPDLVVAAIREIVAQARTTPKRAAGVNCTSNAD